MLALGDGDADDDGGGVGVEHAREGAREGARAARETFGEQCELDPVPWTRLARGGRRCYKLRMALEVTIQTLFHCDQLAELGKAAAMLAQRLEAEDGPHPREGRWEAQWFASDLAKLADGPPVGLQIPGTAPGVVAWGTVGNYTDGRAFVEALSPLWLEALRRNPDGRVNVWAEAEQSESIQCWEVSRRDDEDWGGPRDDQQRFGISVGTDLVVRELTLPLAWAPYVTEQAALGEAPPAHVTARTLCVSLRANSHDDLAAHARQCLGENPDLPRSAARKYLKDLAAREGQTAGPKGGLSLWSYATDELDAAEFARCLEPFWSKAVEYGRALVVHSQPGARMGCFVIHRPYPYDLLGEDGSNDEDLVPEAPLWIRHQWLPVGLSFHPGLLLR